MNNQLFWLFSAAIIALCLSCQKPSKSSIEKPILAQQMDTLLTAYAANGSFHGSVLVYQKGNTLLNKGYGQYPSSLSMENRTSSVYRIYSTTKLFTATMVMWLVERQKLTLEDPLSQYFPDFPHGEKITLAQLLNHTAGIPDATDPSLTINSHTFFVIYQATVLIV